MSEKEVLLDAILDWRDAYENYPTHGLDGLMGLVKQVFEKDIAQMERLKEPGVMAKSDVIHSEVDNYPIQADKSAEWMRRQHSGVSMGCSIADEPCKCCNGEEENPVMVEVPLPPPGQPNANGDVFPEGTAPPVGTKVRHEDKVVGEVEEYGESVIKQALDAAGMTPQDFLAASEEDKIRFNLELTGKVLQRFKLGSPRLDSPVRRLAEHVVGLEARLTRVRNLTIGVTPVGQEVVMTPKKVEIDVDSLNKAYTPIYRLYLVGGDFESICAHPAYARSQILAGALQLYGGIAFKNSDGHWVGNSAVLSWNIGPVKEDLDPDEYTNVVFDGSRHLLCLADDKLLWAVQNVAIEDWELGVQGSLINLQSSKWSATDVRDFRDTGPEDSAPPIHFRTTEDSGEE